MEDIKHTTFLLHCEQVEAWRDGLSEAQAGRLVFAALDFVQDGVEPEFTDSAMKMAWRLLEGALVRDKKVYAEKAEENRDKALRAEIKRLKQRRKVQAEYDALVAAAQETMPGHNNHTAAQETMPGQPITITDAIASAIPSSNVKTSSGPSTAAAVIETKKTGMFHDAFQKAGMFPTEEIENLIRELMAEDYFTVSDIESAIAGVKKELPMDKKQRYLRKILLNWRESKDILKKHGITPNK